jgi:hypothetical protein
MDNSLCEALRVIEREAEREGVQLTRPARLILAHLAESGGEAIVAKLWRGALDRARLSTMSMTSNQLPHRPV